MPERWGFMVDRWHDQTRVAHRLNDDNSPACGAKYYASAGPTEVSETSKCRNCLRRSRIK